MHTRNRYFLLTEIKVITNLFVIVQDLLIYVEPILAVLCGCIMLEKIMYELIIICLLF